MLLLLVILPDGAGVEELGDLVPVHKRPLHRLQGLHHLGRGVGGAGGAGGAALQERQEDGKRESRQDGLGCTVR